MRAKVIQPITKDTATQTSAIRHFLEAVIARIISGASLGVTPFSVRTAAR
jgi:hypothetical protein